VQFVLIFKAVFGEKFLVYRYFRNHSWKFCKATWWS